MLGCQGTDANRPMKLIPALGPHQGSTCSSSWIRGKDAVMMSQDKAAYGPALPRKMPYLELTVQNQWLPLMREPRDGFVFLLRGRFEFSAW